MSNSGDPNWSRPQQPHPQQQGQAQQIHPQQGHAQPPYHNVASPQRAYYHPTSPPYQYPPWPSSPPPYYVLPVPYYPMPPPGYGQAPPAYHVPPHHLPPPPHSHMPPPSNLAPVPTAAPPPTPPASFEAAELRVTSSFRPTGRKRALLIGINYTGALELQGSVRDVTFMVHLLRTKFAFHDNNLFVLTDRPHGIAGVHSGRPTRARILEAMRWLVDGARAGDSLLFHFSGHGSHVKDADGDERSGYDQTILPVDFKSAGHIVDDEIHRVLVRNVPPGARLTAVMDCSCSGTNMDLPYIHDSPDAASDARPKDAPRDDCGEVLLFAACQDDEKASAAAHGGLVSGALTYSLIEAIERGGGSPSHFTYRSLLNGIREKLRVASFQQRPQFSTSHPFDLDTPFLI